MTTITCDKCKNQIGVPENAEATQKYTCPFCNGIINGETLPLCKGLPNIQIINNIGNSTPIDRVVYVDRIPSSTCAVWSMWLGIAGFMLLGIKGGILGLPAVICGHKAIEFIRISKGTLRGRGKAIAGLILGYFSLFIYFTMIISSINNR